MRGRPGLIAGAFALVLGAPAVVLAAGSPAGWWAAAAALVASGASVPAVLWLERAKRAGERLEAPDTGRIRRVSEVDDPHPLGVHPAGPDPHVLPAYIPRDLDGRIRDAMAASGFVLVVGESTAGKSRAAYEGIRATLPEHGLVVPNHVSELQAAMVEVMRQPRVVLWLDDLERFLGEGGLDVFTVETLKREPGHRVIVATMRAAEYEAERKKRESRALFATAAPPVDLARKFTDPELDRAAQHGHDARVAAAVSAARAEHYGVAEQLAAGPDALSTWRNAWDRPGHARAAALVAAAVDCRRTRSYVRGVPREILEDLHEDYLAARGGARLRPESLAEAWAWLAEPVRSTAYLLWSDPVEPDLVRVFDYLVDAERAAGPPPDTLFLRLIEYPPPVYRSALLAVAVAEHRWEFVVEALRRFQDRPEDLGEGTFLVMALSVSQASETNAVDRIAVLRTAWTNTADTSENPSHARFVIGVLLCGQLKQDGREQECGELAIELVAHPLAAEYGLR